VGNELLNDQSDSQSDSPCRVLLIQFAGDYREGYIRMASGGGETYHSQRYSTEKTAEIGRKFGHIGVLCCYGNSPYDEMMDNGVRAMGAGLRAGDSRSEPIIAQIQVFQPTHVILMVPLSDVLAWALNQGLDVLPCFADSFTLSTIGLSPIRVLSRTITHRLRCRRLASLLNSSRIRWVSNHNFKACRDLERIGVDPRKIVPWDWAQTIVPETYEPKSGPSPGEPWRILYVGAINELKGVGDAIESIAELKRRGRDAEFHLIGRGKIDFFSRLARETGVADRVHFEGLQSFTRVIEAMRSFHLVVIPSRAHYPEGLPCVFYEAFATRTPVICSNHPMFQGIVSQEAAVHVPEKRPDALADAVVAVLDNPELYRRMSVATQAAWHRFEGPVLWHELFEHWLRASPEDDRWLAEYSLASGRYPR
jgi:glycosyltransferase involved in cell wall biosynthesis